MQKVGGVKMGISSFELLDNDIICAIRKLSYHQFLLKLMARK